MLPRKKSKQSLAPKKKLQLLIIASGCQGSRRLIRWVHVLDCHIMEIEGFLRLISMA